MRYGCSRSRQHAVQAHDELHVLADRVGPEPAGLEHVSRLNTPKAPEMISSAFIADCATRPARNARRYSTTWNARASCAGARTSVTRPSSTRQPLTMRTMPPTPRSSGASMNGSTARVSAFLEQRVGVDHADQRVAAPR